jgi:hypothetical protein
VNVHERPVGATVEWYTPSSLFDRLGATFDLDPAGAFGAAVPARQIIVKADNGLVGPWSGHVWLNPPYGRPGLSFIDRMIEHADGLLLLPSRTETAAYQRCLLAADAVCLLRDRLWFTRSDGFRGRSSFGSTLFAFGQWAVDILVRADLGWIDLSENAAREADRDAWVNLEETYAMLNAYSKQLETHLRAHGCKHSLGDVADEPAAVA